MKIFIGFIYFIIGYLVMVFCIVGYYNLKRYYKLNKERIVAIRNIKTDLKNKKFSREKAIEYIKFIKHSDQKTVLEFNILWEDQELLDDKK